MVSIPFLPYKTQWIGPLKLYQFTLLQGTLHGVFSRHGGCSEGYWHSLNLSHSVGDSKAHVECNFERACAALQIQPQQTAECRLVHGHDVVQVNLASRRQLLGPADSMITRDPGLVLHMRYADCVPLLFWDPRKRAVGLAHAGWRGTVRNVMAATLEKMTQAFESRPEDIRVLIGPSIGPCCYEVGDDVFTAARVAFSDPSPFFRRVGEKRHFDLWTTNAYQAFRAGVKHIVVSELCTACRTQDFFSHRGEAGKTGRFGVFVGVPQA